MNQSIFQKALPHLVALISFVVISVFFFYPQLQNQKIRQGDTENFKGMAQEIIDHKEKTGEYTLWTNSMFGGMPAYQIISPQSSNIFRYVEKAFTLGFERPIGYFIYGMIAFYILMMVLGVNPWLATIASISFSLMANNLVLFEAGHNTKVRAIMSTPIVIAGVLALSQKRYWVGGSVFVLGMGLNLLANHYQMTYYLGLLIGILVIFEIVNNIKSGDFQHLIKSAAILIFGSLIAFGTGAVKLLPTYEYSKDTMRGESILKSEGVASSSSETEGLEWDYAMMWSNGGIDLLSSFVPGVAGGSSAEKVANDSAFAKELRKRGMRDKNLAAPLYWGALPFTSGPIYFGAIIFFLMILSMFVTKGHFRWWVLISVILTLILSMGKNFEGINRFFFDYVPFYNKFRTPNSILSITTVIIPFLGFYGFNQILKLKDKTTLLKPLMIVAGVFGVILLYLAVIAPSSMNLASAGDARYPDDIGRLLQADRASLMSSDSWRTLILIALFVAALWAFIKDKIGKMPLLIIAGVLILFDQVSVGRRYIDTDSFISERQLDAQLNPRNVDELIMKDGDPHFRVLDTTIPTFESSFASNFHKTIGGNHAAKLQRIQDVIERHISQGNMSVLNMLNTKYFIQNNPETNEAAFNLNTAALGNAWFVNELKMVDNANAEIDALNDIDPAGTAVVHQEFADYVTGLNVAKAGVIELTSYAPNKLVYQTNNTSEQFAVFSEVWYGPNKGWNATINGEPAEHIRVDYLLRGMRVPAGKNEIIFEFDPQIYKTGSMISLVSSIVILIGFALLMFQWWRKNKSQVVQLA